MTAFCLLHSSGQGPEGWKLVVRELERRGHRALTPAFHLDKTDEGAAWHADTIVDALKSSGHDPSSVICVAHSAAGIYLPIIADRWPARRMVFLAAVIPRPGISIRDQLRADPSMFNPAWIGKNPMEVDVALEFVFHDCPASRLEWALSTRVLFYAKRAIEEACPLSTWPAVPASYIVCTEDRTISPAWQRRVAREWLNVEPVEISSGHAPLVSQPEALAEVLDGLAAMTRD
ncbi:MAG TPA: alpha/beta hydrolase [Blastocatellia bacterium]|nr:alpha/beta hydrolase [Blastocatellia bacterium]